MKSVLIGTLAVILAAGAQSNEAERQLKAAMNAELVNGDLKTAIKQYGEIVARYKNDRAVAAMALVRMADCYRKLGDAEARKIYERVLREYADQKEPVAMARAKLSGTLRASRETSSLVWSRPQLGMRGRVSVDGRYLSFTDGSDDLVMHEIASGEDRRLTELYKQPASKDRGALADGSVISRDGKQILYLWYRWDGSKESSELRLASLTGNPNPTRLYDSPDVNWYRPWDWSPDGKWASVEIFRKDRTHQIGLISIPDGSLRVLKSVDWRGAAGLFFSPDGKYLGYDLPPNDTRPERDVYVVSLDGSQEIHAIAHPANDSMMGWSPDGKRILFASDRRGTTDLWGLRFADGKPQGTPELLRANIPIAPLVEPMGVTNSGTLYYGTARSQDRFKIQIADLDAVAGKLSNPTDIAQDYLESIALPEWSPDGRKVAFKSQRGSAQRRSHEVVVIRSLDTGQIRELRPKLSYFGPMVWSPDGRSFLTLGGDLKGRAGIYQIDVETGDATVLVLDQPSERLWYPRWSHDGKSFYFKRDYRAKKESVLIRRDLTTGDETELVRRQLLAQANPSPDERYLASRGIDESANMRTLLLIPATGGEVRELLRYSSEVTAEELGDGRKGVWFLPFIWATDSRSLIAFKIRGRQDPSNVLGAWRIPIDGGEPQKLDDSLKSSLGIAAPQLDPSGRRLAYTVTEPAPQRDPEIWAIENFLPAGK